MTLLDIQLVDTHKSTQIAFADISRYDTAPTNPSFEIVVPGYNKVNVPFSPQLVNIFNATILKLGNDVEGVWLPDGVYTVYYSVAPNEITKITRSFMRTAQADAQYKRLFLQIDNDCDCNNDKKKDLKQSLLDIKLMIDGSVAAADNCDIGTANKLYKQAIRQMENMKLCNC